MTRPKIDALDEKSIDKLNETFHFQHDSTMSIQPGHLKKGNPSMQFNHQTSPFSKGKEAHAISRFLPNVNHDDLITFDVSTPEIPDAMDRIKRSKIEQKTEKL